MFALSDSFRSNLGLGPFLRTYAAVTDTSESLISVLQYLLPGLVSAWIFYGFTPYDRPEHFERIVQALIFTAVVQAITDSILIFAPGIPIPSLAVSLLVAVPIGFTAVQIANRDTLHRWLRSLRWTGETSFASEWYRAFDQYSPGYVLVELRDGRQVSGYVLAWASRPSGGHLGLQNVEWLGSEPHVLGAPSAIKELLIPVEEILMLYFLEADDDPRD